MAETEQPDKANASTPTLRAATPTDAVAETATT